MLNSYEHFPPNVTGHYYVKYVLYQNSILFILIRHSKGHILLKFLDFYFLINPLPLIIILINQYCLSWTTVSFATSQFPHLLFANRF